ncbi:hypothetical protein CL628_02320 [bacterium]|nr:hypothetical protein [bacterium]
MSLLPWFDFTLGFMAVAVIGSILPDVDMLIYLLFGGKLDKWAHRHRDISHYPLLTVPICLFIALHVLVWQQAVVLAAVMLMHYVLDSQHVGWGIRWTFPVTRTYYCLRTPDPTCEPFMLYAWTRRQQDMMVERYGDDSWAKDRGQWIFEGCLLAGTLAVAAFFLANNYHVWEYWP